MKVEDSEVVKYELQSRDGDDAGGAWATQGLRCTFESATKSVRNMVRFFPRKAWRAVDLEGRTVLAMHPKKRSS